MKCEDRDKLVKCIDKLEAGVKEQQERLTVHKEEPKHAHDKIVKSKRRLNEA